MFIVRPIPEFSKLSKNINMIVPKKFPDLKGKIDDKAETELHITIQRLYEYIDNIVVQVKKELESKIKTGDLASTDFNNLIGVFSQPLAGSTITDPLLQSITQSFGVQNATFFFGGPTPSFRAITLADIPAGVGITNGAPVDNIPKSDGTDLVPSLLNDDGNDITIPAPNKVIIGASTLLSVDSNQNLVLLNMFQLPNVDPGISGAIWNNGGVLNVSP